MKIREALLISVMASPLLVAFQISTLRAYLVTTLLYGLFIGYILWEEQSSEIVLDKYYAVLFGAIFISFIIGTMQNPSFFAYIRCIAFVVFGLVNLFIIPANVSRGDFNRLLVQLSTLLALVGMSALLIGPIGPVGLWKTPAALLGTSINTYPIQSIFTNPNRLAFISVVGALAGIAVFIREHSFLYLLASSINILSVYLTQSRSALFALIVSLSVVVTYIIFPTPLSKVGIVGIVGAVPVMVLIMAGIIPGPQIVQQISLTGREALWKAAYRAILQKPYFGWGTVNTNAVVEMYLSASDLEETWVQVEDLAGNTTHNGYLRTFIMGGIVAGGSYILLCIYAILNYVMNIESDSLVGDLSILTSVIVMNLFEEMSMFGIGFSSIIVAVIIGYGQIEIGAHNGLLKRESIAKSLPISVSDK